MPQKYYSNMIYTINNSNFISGGSAHINPNNLITIYCYDNLSNIILNEFLYTLTDEITNVVKII